MFDPIAHRSLNLWMIAFLLAIFSFSATRPVVAQSPGETDQERAERMDWWRDARFGMFIHWGLYAVPAGEWKGQPIDGVGEWIQNKAGISPEEYTPLAKQFNPVRFDADAWVRLAKSAGMKYIVITSKHHDGFCLWPSQQTDYDVESTPYQKNLLGQLSAACKKHDVQLCFYYSIMDWHHPDYLPRHGWDPRPDDGADYDRYVAYMKGQLTELIEAYDPGIIWFDGEWEKTWTHERGVDLDDFCRGLKADVIINNRVDKGRVGMEGLTREGDFRGDYGTPEQEIPPTGLPGVDWESCMTMNDTWGYKKQDHNWKSTETLIRNLVDITSKGGNYLLNVGPTALGEIPSASVKRLQEIGKWIETNGEAIYGTTASPCERPTWGRITTKTEGDATRLYLCVFDWPADGKLTLPISNRAQGCHLLADKIRQFVTNHSSENGLAIELTGDAPDAICSVVVLDLLGQPEVNP